MGIKGLTNVIRKEAPMGIKTTKITSLKFVKTKPPCHTAQKNIE